jgi:acyl dehydratase
MTFAYVGYIWALLGCSFLAMFVGVVAFALYQIGKRVDRGAPRTTVESLPVARAAAAGDTSPVRGDGEPE